MLIKKIVILLYCCAGSAVAYGQVVEDSLSQKYQWDWNIAVGTRKFLFRQTSYQKTPPFSPLAKIEAWHKKKHVGISLRGDYIWYWNGDGLIDTVANWNLGGYAIGEIPVYLDLFYDIHIGRLQKIRIAFGGGWGIFYGAGYGRKLIKNEEFLFSISIAYTLKWLQLELRTDLIPAQAITEKQFHPLDDLQVPSLSGIIYLRGIRLP